MSIQIDSAGPEEKESVVSLLEEVDLLMEDLPGSLHNFLLAKEDGTLVGVAGLCPSSAVVMKRNLKHQNG